MEHIEMMNLALEQAKLAYNQNEVPIGAVIIHKNKVIAKAHNLRETNASVIAHAEILAMEQAASYLGTWNLSECTLYVSVEPCPMCAGALLQAQMGTIVFGVREPNSGSFGSVINLAEQKFNHKPLIVEGVLMKECQALMQDFFKQKRIQAIKVKALDASLLADYYAIREAVFVHEQAVDLELEYDEYDIANHKDVIHIGAFIDHKMVGTMRLVKKGKILKLGRLAVLKENRKDGVGTAFLKYAEKQAHNNGFELIELGAQVSAMGFYEKNGYQRYGDVFLDADIDHMMMKKEIQKR